MDRIMILVTLLYFFCMTVVIAHESVLQLLVANQKDIKVVSISNIDEDEQFNVTTLTNDLDVAATVDFVYDDQLIIWSDIGFENIRGMRMNSSKSLPFDVITSEIMSPDGVRCDWITKKLYWLDSELNRIEVAQFDGNNRKVLYWQDFDQPRGLALVPHKGIMFWTDWGDVPKIERASMDGDLSSRRVIVDKNIEWPNGVTVDFETDRVYWVDAKLQRIESAGFDGSDRQTVLNENIPHPFAVTVFKDHLFWTDWVNKSVNLCNKKDGKNRQEVISSENPYKLHPMDIHVFTRERQPKHPNPCAESNAGCSHLCLPSSESPSGTTCACPTGIRLMSDQRTCYSKPDSLLIIARQSDVRKASLDMPDYTHMMINVRGVKHAIAVEYDVATERVFWTDDDAHIIRSVFLNGSSPADVASIDVDQPEGLAIDWVARNLYWTDNGYDKIEVARLNGSHRKVLISEGLFEPRAIAVHPERGFFYWTDWGQEPKIERANLDGSNRRTIISNGIKWPNSLTIDYENDRIYWCDAFYDVIETALLDGSGRRPLVSEHLPHVFSVTILGDWLYWNDWAERSVERVNKVTGSSRELIIDQLPDMMALKASHTDKSKLRGTNACAFRNGNCSQLCLFTPDMNVGEVPSGSSLPSPCHCATGFRLQPDGRSCAADEHYVPEPRVRKPPEGRIKDKPVSPRKPCQNNGDCSHHCTPLPDGKGRKCGCPEPLILADDEKTCVELLSCAKDQFQCKSGRVTCIPEAWICDGVPECNDKSDEENCPECRPGDFRCPDSRFCLPPTKICDNHPDCPDGSDELCCDLNHFVCRPENRKECIDSRNICDGQRDCKNGADEEPKNCPASVADKTITVTDSYPSNNYYVTPVCISVFFLILGSVLWFRRKQTRMPIDQPDLLPSNYPLTDRFPDCRTMTMTKDSTLTRSRMHSNPGSCHAMIPGVEAIFDRSIVNSGSSTSSSAHRFPKETVNPPPSPATDRSQCHYDTSCSSHSATRSSSQAASAVLFPPGQGRYKRLFRGPPSAAYSNDPNDSEFYGSTAHYSYSNSQVDPYDAYPPLPTPQYVSEASTPPSPCTERSYFHRNPYPNPPPSPVPSNH